ncbi:MAG: hypothetical protein C0459_08195 [Chitinophaga sp.]|jgi:uncharacterized membrane protein SpoIIM required for sporulation|nr:hypothetical protein [Chitinophaga sp.]
MRETLFIKKNKDKWEAFDAENSIDPDELSYKYTQVLDDLAYAKTFYPKSKTAQYLNERAVKFYNNIYSRRKERISALFNFFKTDLPIAIRQNHKQLLYALIFFMLFVLIGVVSAIYESGFLKVIVGDSYIEMTKANIQKGDPFGVYKDGNHFVMFLRISLNNILITILLDYATGVLFGVGTLYSLMVNGVMLGSFQYFFFEYGWGWQSILVIWIHGTLEISAIVIAGGAGLTLGNSILFPGTLKRMQSLQKGAERSAKILVMTIIMLLVAAWLESYVTHLSSNYFDKEANQIELPVWGSALILLASLSFVLWYFIFYPLAVERKLKKAAA